MCTKYDVRNYALQLSQNCHASIACSKHIFNLHHEHQIKGLFPHPSNSQAWFILPGLIDFCVQSVVYRFLGQWDLGFLTFPVIELTFGQSEIVFAQWPSRNASCHLCLANIVRPVLCPSFEHSY
jgi:hypothetical protein